jgi:hypothetical protein
LPVIVILKNTLPSSVRCGSPKKISESEKNVFTF